MLRWFWNGITTSNGLGCRGLRFLLFCAGLGWGILFVSLPLAWQGQAVLGILIIAGGVAISKASESKLVTIALMVLSMFATVRYAWWRTSAVIAFFQDPSNKWDWADASCIIILLSAEAYAFAILFLGFMQTISPLKRPPVPLPKNEQEWPHIDLLIPTYNEPLSVVRFTALASMNVDWPADKLHIYILDDGKREPFRAFAQEAGIGYITRDDNAHAKAGNINRALQGLDSPFVAIFDCDHLPTRSFLQVTMGWFDHEARLAMVQTPHHFYSADPFERNLKQFRLIPNEGELFYGVVQDGNDFWNATFFCGSCAVLRRTALDEIGGIAVETVTEDAHTSLRMQMRGWNTAYINIPQAAGLATERLSGHIQQRVRWARGMIQILRTDNPLFAKGLKFAQRICYFNAMTHFLYAVPRLIFLTAPLVYLFFSRSNVPGYWAAILAYAMPHLVLSNVTNSRIQGQHRHSFWNEIYETVLAPYILLPTLTALINPKLGKFNVTAKGGFVEETYFDSGIAKPFVLLMTLNLAGILMIFPRLLHIPGMEWFYDAGHPGTITMNALWCVFNLIILGVAITVAREEIQRREQVRIDFEMPARVRLADGTIIAGHTIDISIGGTALTLRDNFAFTPGEWVTLLLPLRVGDAELPASIVGRDGDMLRLQFETLTLLQEEMLTTILYSRADAWLNWGETRERDRPLRSFFRILKLSVRGMFATLRMLTPKRATAAKVPAIASRVAPMLLCFMLAAACRPARAGGPITKRAKTSATSPSAFSEDLTLKDLGVDAPIDLRGLDGFNTVAFVLARDQVIDHAVLHLAYRAAPGSSEGRLKVILNGTAFATLQPPPGHIGDLNQQDLTLPSDLLVRKNELTFQFVSRPDARCEEHASDISWGRIDLASRISLSGQRLHLADDLLLLPLPFIDADVTRGRSVPIVLAATPSPMALQAAGVVASYFGVAAEYPVPRFPISLGTLPRGNVVVIAESSSSLLSGLNLGNVSAPLLAIRNNPNDPFGKLLILTGADGDQLLLAAQALALRGPEVRGMSASVQDFTLPQFRLADDAPRWAAIETKAPLWDPTESSSRPSDGSGPLQIFLRVPPDLYAADKLNLKLHLDYSYTRAGVARGSALLLRANGSEIGSILLKPSKDATVTHADVPLPVRSLRPFSNSLSAQWSIERGHAGHCGFIAPTIFSGAIQGTSYLDLRGLSHWAALPNLELFSNAGFPFTRFADLSQTTIILPTHPSAQEIELYLTLLAHLGAQTGYPALHVLTGDASLLHPGADTDFLIIGTGPQDAAIAQVADRLPVQFDGQQLVATHADGRFAWLQQAWGKLTRRFNGTPEPPRLDALPAPGALLEGIESPYARNRSLVVVEIKDAASFEPFLTAFLNATHSSEISGDVSILAGPAFQSFRVEDTTYALGTRPWLTRLKVSAIHGPWFLVLGLLVFSLFSAAWVQARLRHMSKVRLHLEEITA